MGAMTLFLPPFIPKTNAHFSENTQDKESVYFRSTGPGKMGFWSNLDIFRTIWGFGITSRLWAIPTFMNKQLSENLTHKQTYCIVL